MSGLIPFIVVYLLTVTIYKLCLENSYDAKMFIIQEQNITEEQYDNLCKWVEIIALIPILNTLLLIIAIIRNNVH